MKDDLEKAQECAHALVRYFSQETFRLAQAMQQAESLLQENAETAYHILARARRIRQASTALDHTIRVCLALRKEEGQWSTK